MVAISANRQKKIDKVDELHQYYASSSGYIFLINYTGLTSDVVFAIRSDLNKVNSRMIVVKNTINKIALERSGFNLLIDYLSGQMAAICTQDPIAVAKILKKYHDEGNIKVIAYCDTKAVYGAESLSDLADLSSVDSLRMQLLGVLLSVPSKCVTLLKEPQSLFIRLCTQYTKNKKEN